MTETSRWVLATVLAAAVHLLMLAWALPGFSLWRGTESVFDRSVALLGDGDELDRPFVPVTLPSGPLSMDWSLGSLNPPPRQAAAFERPAGARRGALSLSELGQAETEADQAEIREALGDALSRLDALAAAPAEFIAEISLAGAQLRLAPMSGGMPLRESDALAHQTGGRDRELASAPLSTERPAVVSQPSPRPRRASESAPPVTHSTEQTAVPPRPTALPDAQPQGPLPTATPAMAPTLTATVTPTEARAEVPPPSPPPPAAEPTRIVPEIYPPVPPNAALPASPTPLTPQVYPPATPSPSPTPRPLLELSAPRPTWQAPPRDGLIIGEGNIPEQGAGEFTANSNVFFSRLTAHLFAANQRALAAAILAGPRLTLEVRFRIDRNGRVLDARVVNSSGIEALDRRAEQVLLDASPVPRLAQDMPQETLELSFPVDVYR